MNYDKLYFGVSEAQPESQNVNVYARLQTEFLGEPFEFNIIGNSHYIHSSAYNYHEISSCEEVDYDGVHVVDLTKDIDRTFSYTTDQLACEMNVVSHPLSEFPQGKGFDLAYKFETDAYTTIDLGETDYKTWHTYPEFDLALFTQTEFAQLTDDSPTKQRHAANSVV